ncbi:MAG: type II toxin-antitoxin system VapC family toxin [Coriobacteriia bacterium]|nr:type II toxin-antitoxin system VapC family toxin [Coriobacteriia bacterium]
MSEAAVRRVVDTSVTTKWFVAERESHVAESWELLQDHLAGAAALASPDHMRLEVLNALKQRRFDGDELMRVADVLEGFRLQWHPVDAQLARAAGSIAARYGLTLYDAAFAALAVELDCELVTADRRLASSGACRARLLG